MQASGNNMNDRRKKYSWTPEENPDQSEVLKITQNKLKINRLKRSPTNQTQRSGINTSRAETDFKTPTRVPKVGFRSSATDESPSNDAELQHEIIWDPTSPVTPVRNGRGRRRAAVFKSVDISDIVNRIAPKSKKPEEAESSLLQWIGDTAVPCTPEIREPRTKPKPTRQNPVEDLLKLAKQFDFNMIQQEEAHLRPNPQSSSEAMHKDQDLFFNEHEPPASPLTRSEAERPPLGLEDIETKGDDPLDDAGPGQETEDDLDLLFEGSTQQLSGSLSPGFSTRSQSSAKFAPQSGVSLAARMSADWANVCGVIRVGGASKASTILSTIGKMEVTDDFDDDWNDDGLLDDLHVMEMTQNPELFSVPQHSSTQKQTNTNDGPANTTYRQHGDEAKCGKVQRLDQVPESVLCGRHLQKTKGDENAKQSGLHAKNNLETQVPLMVPGSRSVSKTTSQPKKPIEIKQTFATTTSDSTWKFHSPTLIRRSVPSAMTETTSTIRNTKVTEKKEIHPAVEDGVLGDLAAEDLDSIFASDDVWDNGEDDDDLFCAACEKIEESMAEPQPLPKASVSILTSLSSQSTMGKRESVPILRSPSNTTVYHQSATGNRAPLSTGVLNEARNNNTSGKFKFSRAKIATETGSAVCTTAGQVGKSVTATIVQSYRRTQDNTFNTAPAVSKDMSKAEVTRCSDAEIERKKQQAIERRRLRMLANQNFPAPVRHHITTKMHKADPVMVAGLNRPYVEH